MGSAEWWESFWQRAVAAVARLPPGIVGRVGVSPRLLPDQPRPEMTDWLALKTNATLAASRT